MAESMTIRVIVERLMSGQIRVPAFQRGFVWDTDMVAYFMDSLYKKYPFGSVLFWRTKEQLKVERSLGPFKLPNRDPDFPIDYILDGQQRITSIFGVFQTDLPESEREDWTHIYFDYTADPDAQDSQFVALKPHEVDSDKHFALRNLFDTTAYRKATRDFDEVRAAHIDKMQAVFKEAQIPVQTLDTNDRATVAIVFERVNQRNVPLDTFQLLSAWTWSDEFYLQSQFEELTTDLEPFGFEEVGEDTNLLLRCCAAVIANSATAKTLINLNGAQVRDRFQEIINGLKGAIDFLNQNLNIFSLENLPYKQFLIPLAVFFAVVGDGHFRYTDEQRRTIVKWFWRTCFTRRYNSQTIKSVQNDINEILKLRNGERSELGNVMTKVDGTYFKNNLFRMSTVTTKTFILMLAQKYPRSFITGSQVSLRDVLRDYNKNEFHHLYPKAYLQTIDDKKYDVNCLANFCFLSKADNVALGPKRPSIYRNKMPENVDTILERAICPPSLFSDNFHAFIDERSELLAQESTKLTN
jgi:hypothetical protein